MMIGYILSILMMLSVLHGGPNSPQKENTTMKLFLSYCHHDKKHLDAFCKHITPLMHKGAITAWHDREIPVGGHIEQAIDANLESADIIALFISADFLASDNCRKEVETALSLKEKNKADIMPIIVSRCDWKDYSNLGEFKACPTDGKAVEDWKNTDHAWESVTKHLKGLLSCLVVEKKEFTENFQKFLDSPGEFIHDSIPTLRDIYVPSVLMRAPRLDEDDVTMHQESAKFLENLDSGVPRNPIFILGDELSGKTTLCRTLCQQYKNAGSVPVYIDGRNVSNDNLNQIERSAFKEQYRHLSSSSVGDDKKIILFDNFAGESMKKRDLLSLLSKMGKRSYRAVILTADAANALFINVQWEKISIDYQITTYRIKPTGYKTRAKIVEKWVNNTQKTNDKEAQERLTDAYREHIDAISTGNAIPSHPFYILTILENMAGAQAWHQPEMGVDKTSYGHCYTALVTRALLRAGVHPLKIDKYFNVLTDLAYYIYQQGKAEINESEFSAFIKKYEDLYMEAPHMALDTLLKSGVLSHNLFSIRMQEYMFYYFTARYLSQNFFDESAKDRCKDEIETIMSNAHQKRSGNILLFLVHHMPKSRYLLDKLNDELDALLHDIPEATLSSEETEPLGEFLRDLPKIAIEPSASESGIKTAREHHVDKSSKRESAEDHLHEKADKAGGREIVITSKSFRMMNIVGSLLKNQYGTMEKSLLAALAMRLRGLTFRIVRCAHIGIVEKPEIVMSFVRDVMSKHRHWKNIPAHEQERAVKLLVGGLALGSAYTLIDRCALSIGSDKLIALINEISKQQEVSSPAHQLLYLAASLWYGKNLHIKDNLLKDIESMNEQWKGNLLATRLLRDIVTNHLYMRRVDYKTRSHLAHTLDLDVKAQLIGHQRHKT